MNGQNETEMGRARDAMHLEPLVCFFVSLLIVFFLKTTNLFFTDWASKQVNEMEMELVRDSSCEATQAPALFIIILTNIYR